MPNSSKNLSVTLAPNGKLATRYYLLAAFVLVIDQISKYFFNTRFELGETMDVIAPVLNWTLAYNYGAAFSFMADAGGWQKWFFAGLGLFVSVFIITYLRQVPKSAHLLSFGLALVLGGAIGNVIDRFIHGYVIDFIHVHYADVWHYPIFNIADIGICVGMAFVVIDMLFFEAKRKQE
ncbi:signal peptidase II [Moraxella caviae]|uniref:Lipoprotein signal peptidase n=1 Tax=Moraxella caviae TaxID=34060 RepID=A0A1T0A2C6_9GAMM|nr:signal peptidase II [Moraxella caviae]OOR89421.1 signal peptidase II [Moraxella caviae]STZ09855.1 Lipoprotein signal peptidase [Moraxella caviae]VEW13069.1 Lipoprotein signal peptidase [Moraxella caviae]